MTKPSLSSAFAVANPHAWGPFYGFREGSGSTTIDDTPLSATALSLMGAAQWVGKVNGPEIRISVPGDFLSAADAPEFQKASTAFTVAVGVTPSGTWTYNGTGPLIAGKMLGYYHVSFGIFATGSGVRTVLSIDGDTMYYTPDSAAARLINGTAYLLVARWQSGAHLNLRIYNRTTGTLVTEMSGTTTHNWSTISDASPPVGAIFYDAQPFLVGRHVLSDGGNPDYAYGDYEFVAVSDKRLSDSDVNAFVANPWADYSASSANYALSGPSTGLPGLASSAFKVQLNYGYNPASPVTITPSIAGMTGTFNPTTVSLSTAIRSAAFTFTPSMSTAIGTTGALSVENAGTLTNPTTILFTTTYAALNNLAYFQSQLTWPLTVNPYVAGDGFWLNGSEHYDPTRCFQNVRDYMVKNGLTPTDWSAPIAASLVRFRDRYVLTYGTVQLYHAYSTGIAYHYLETGNLDSRDAVVFLDPIFMSTAVFARYFKTMGGSRETAFAMIDSLESECLGRSHAELTDILAYYALGHIDQWMRPAGQRYWSVYVRPFMVALTCEALISYWTRYRHNPSTDTVTINASIITTQAQLIADIPGRIKTAIDWIWEHCWYPAGMAVNVDQSTSPWIHGSFAYTDVPTSTGRTTPISTVVSDASPTTTSFKGATSLSTQDDYYKYAYIKWTSGTLAGSFFRIDRYAGATRTFTLDPDYGLLPSAPANGDTFDIMEDTGLGHSNTGDTGAAPDVNHLIAPAFAWYYWYTVNVAGTRENAYRQRFDDIFSGGTMCHSTPTAQKQFNQATRWLFTGFDWRERGDAEWPAATSFTITAPTPASSQANMPSGLFTVALPPGKSVANPVTVTLTCSTGHGSFVPDRVVLTTERPKAMFHFVPAQADANASVTLSVSNDAGLGNPASISYVVGTTKILAEGYHAIGPATGTVNSAAPFVLETVPADAALPVAWLRGGGGALRVQPIDQWAGGTFENPAHPGATSFLVLSAERPRQTFTYTPKSVGAKSLTFPNFAGVSEPTTLPFLVTATAAAVSSAAAMLLGM